MSFDAFAEHIRKEEGGLVDHPSDPGGRTNMGVTQRKLDAARTAYPALRLPSKVDDLSWSQAREIYSRDYWQPVRGDDLPPGIGLLVGDAAVNQGPSRAIKWLQQAARVSADGNLGPMTLAAVKTADQKALMVEYASRRAYHYMTLDAIDDTFGLGWSRRLFRTFTAALEAK